MTRPLRLGTRGSALARTQSQLVADEITTRTGRAVDLVIIRTLGDVTSGPLASMPQPGVFVSALRTALLDDEVDLVVHSMKDLPSEPTDGICLAAVPPRVDPHDALVSAGNLRLLDLPVSARVGTSSPRRAARLRATRPDLVLSDLRGNVDSRIAKVRTGALDATILAVAGLSRLGRLAEVAEVIDMAVMLPAPAQGALAIECRTSDGEVTSLLAELDDPATRLTTAAERAVLSRVSATCASAVGAHAIMAYAGMTLTADVSGRAAGEYVSHTATAPIPAGGADAAEAARGLGVLVAERLLEAGAGPFISPERTRD